MATVKRCKDCQHWRSAAMPEFAGVAWQGYCVEPRLVGFNGGWGVGQPREPLPAWGPPKDGLRANGAGQAGAEFGCIHWEKQT